MAVALTLSGESNGETLDVTVYEDLDQDGEAENQETRTVDTISGTYIFTDLEGGTGNDYWVQFDLSTSDVESSPQVDSATLESEPEYGLYATVDLNGESATATVYEDTDQDGESDNSQQVTLSDGSDYYSLGDLELGSNRDYWIQFDLSTSDVESSPQVDSATLLTRDEEFISAVEATISTASPNAGIDAGGSGIAADAGSATVVGQNAGLDPGAASIPGDVAILDVAGVDPGVSPGQASIEADAGVLQITAETVARVFDSAELAGTVTLNGDPVDGAAVYAIDDLGSFGGVGDTNTERFDGVATLTDSDGNYTIRVDAGETYHLAYQYEDGDGNQYNALSKPFLVP